MHRIFPRALLACIVEGRPPNARELACVTSKVRREAFAVGALERDSRAALIARAALGAGEMPSSLTATYIVRPNISAEAGGTLRASRARIGEAID